MNVKKNMVLAAMGLVMAFGAASTASADIVRYDGHHPRQAEAPGRVASQEHRITVQRREGELTARQARHLRAEDRRIARQDRREARVNGGYISKAQQHRLNREENRVSRHIGA